MKKDKYRIIEIDGKFYLEKLLKIFFFSYYERMTYYSNDDYIYYEFDTLDEANDFVSEIVIKYHKPKIYNP